jgi:hypothetical protein
MAFEQKPTKEGVIPPQTQAGETKKPTLRDAHGHGISAQSSYDLMDHVFTPREYEGQVGAQSGPQPSGGQPGMRPQLGSFEAGQTDFGSGAPGEDVEPGNPTFIGIDSDLPKKMKKPVPGEKPKK